MLLHTCKVYALHAEHNKWKEEGKGGKEWRNSGKKMEIKGGKKEGKFTFNKLLFVENKLSIPSYQFSVVTKNDWFIGFTFL